MSHASHICVCNGGHALDDYQVLIDFENTGDQRHRDNFIIFPMHTFDDCINDVCSDDSTDTSSAWSAGCPCFAMYFKQKGQRK